jgi:hypothetical protein
VSKLPKVTHEVTVYYLSGPMVFRGTLGYVREIRASAIMDNTSVSGIREIKPKEEK